MRPLRLYGSKDLLRLSELTQPLHVVDMAGLFQALSGYNRTRLEGLLGDDPDAELFVHLAEAVREDLLDEFDAEKLVQVVNHLDRYDAVELIKVLEDEERRTLLDSISGPDRLLPWWCDRHNDEPYNALCGFSLM